MRLRLIMKIGVAALLINGTSAFALNQTMSCPGLTTNDVLSVIERGTISTNQGYSLADEAGESRAQVLINEPTANPFDTYYQMSGKKNINNQDFYIYIGNILGKAPYEAIDRAKKILLNGEKVFSASYDPQSKVCMYKEVHASSSIAGYPFKSTYESVVLLATPYDEQQEAIHGLMRKKYRS